MYKERQLCWFVCVIKKSELTVLIKAYMCTCCCVAFMGKLSCIVQLSAGVGKHCIRQPLTFPFCFSDLQLEHRQLQFYLPQPWILTSKVIGAHHICCRQITNFLTITRLQKKNPVDQRHPLIVPLPPPETVYTDVTLLSNCCSHLSSAHTHGWRVAKEA